MYKIQSNFQFTAKINKNKYFYLQYFSLHIVHLI